MEPVFLRSSLWNASWMRFTDQKFEDEKAKPIALERARTFMMVLQPQLQKIGAIKGPAGKDSDQYWREVTNELAEIFAHALMTAGLINSSKDPIDHQWVQSGTVVDYATMRMTRREREPGLVRYAKSPTVWISGTGREEHKVIVSKALFILSKRKAVAVEE